MEIKKYTLDELELIFDIDFVKFLKISAYHKENNPEYFKTVIVPFYAKQKKAGKVPDYDSAGNIQVKSQEQDSSTNIAMNNIVLNNTTKVVPSHTASELENIALTDSKRFDELVQYYSDRDYYFYINTVSPIIKRLKSNETKILSNPKTVLSDFKPVRLEKYNNINNFTGHNSTAIEIKPARNVKKRNNIIISVLLVLIIIAATLLYYLAIYNNNDRQVIRHLKNKEFNIALNKIDTLSPNFHKLKPKYYYARGGLDFQDNKIRNAYINLSKVGNDDEFFQDAKDIISKIETDPNLIYQKGKDHINAEEYDLAGTEFKKIKSNDNIFNSAQSKLAFINGLLEFKNNNFETANYLFQQVNKSDEYYDKVIELQPRINQYLTEKADNEANLAFSRFLIRIADDIQDEYQLFSQQNTFAYTKNTLLPKLISQRSEINRYIYNAKNQNKDIIEFKKLILSWVNAYVKYGEDLVDFGYKSNYVGDRMWRDYGYILYDDKDKGYYLHQKVLKKYKSIKTLFNIN